MRLWSLHPSYLDAKGLVAAWREALLAQKVLAGKTAGYRQHPQLMRFRAAHDPGAAIATFLRAIQEEATSRGYNFDATKIPNLSADAQIEVSSGQIAYEADFLLAKLRSRAPGSHQEVILAQDCVEPDNLIIRVHPLFTVVPGPIANWEKIPPDYQPQFLPPHYFSREQP
ncbi:MAG: pyrimidine dimer DNA glycosylase/endonuclease V [Corynebacterium sp.]|nr:pyrimidine dimer DNA glycosylase/endonuclease V [Corynebacterium sp.]